MGFDNKKVSKEEEDDTLKWTTSYQWFSFVFSGIFFGTMIAVMGGYSFGAGSTLMSADYWTNVDPSRAIASVELQKMRKADFVRFAEGTSVGKIYAARKFSKKKKHFYCAAPVIRKEKAGMMVYFYVISRSKCCLTDAYNCKGWDHENGFVGEVIPLVEHRFHLYDKA